VEDSFCRDGEAGAEYAHDWVSARNLVMLSLMTAWAETNKFGYIALGNNLEEAGAYPDNEEEFGNRFNAILPFATQNGVKIELLQPLSTYMKHEIVKLGLELGVPYHLTWSCYGDGRKPCNECGPCYMRRVAFERNGTVDPLLK
jgi:7-cyano-7-deazaguanine synthase